MPQPSLLYREIADQPWPTALLLDLTDACDLRCAMCHYWGEAGIFTSPRRRLRRPRPSTLPIDLALDLVRQLAPGRPSYALFGGEPLLYPHLAELITAIKRAGSVVSLVTNGATLEQRAPMLVELGVDAIRVSLDGPPAVNDAQRGAGSYQRAVDGLLALWQLREQRRQRLPSVGIACAVTANNHLHLYDFLTRDLDLGLLDAISVNLYIHLPRRLGRAFGRMLGQEFGIEDRGHWRASLRPPGFFDDIDCDELAAQIEALRALHRHYGRGPFETTPRTTSAANLRAYFSGEPEAMVDRYDFCIAPWTSLQITARGEVLPCMGATDFVLGDITEQPFAEIWHGPAYEQLRQRLLTRGMMPHCFACCMLPRLGHWRRPRRVFSARDGANRSLT